MSASVTMSVAQRLYENGFITYMRTDSTTLSGAAVERGPVAGARAVRRGVPPRRAAHLRPQGQERPGGARGDPAGRRRRSARPAQTGLTGDQFRLYELIWMRTVASQMKDAVGQSVSVRLGGAAVRRARTSCSPRPAG